MSRRPLTLPARLIGSVVGQRWAFFLLGIHAALLAYSATRHSPTWDEPFHLWGGVRRWECGRFDLNIGNPPLVGMIAALPVLATSPQTDWTRAPNLYFVGFDFMAANGPRSLGMVTLAATTDSTANLLDATGLPGGVSLAQLPTRDDVTSIVTIRRARRQHSGVLGIRLV